NGIVVLAIAASIIILAFDADLTRLIQLYVIGVFMSFTLSQSGMVVHWSRERRSGTTPRRVWRRPIVINVIGAPAPGPGPPPRLAPLHRDQRDRGPRHRHRARGRHDLEVHCRRLALDAVHGHPRHDVPVDPPPLHGGDAPAAAERGPARGDRRQPHGARHP